MSHTYRTHTFATATNALARQFVSANPAYDAHVSGNDGQSAHCLFVYLRGILALTNLARHQSGAGLASPCGQRRMRRRGVCARKSCTCGPLRTI